MEVTKEIKRYFRDIKQLNRRYILGKYTADMERVRFAEKTEEWPEQKS